MQINKQDLLTALEIVKPGLANKEMIEQSTSFAFMENRIVTYNDEISISHPIEGLNLKGAVKAELLYQTLRKLKKDELELEVKEAEVIIKSGKATAAFALQTEIKLPLEEVEEAEKWIQTPSNFLEALTFALSSCSRDMSRPILTCVHVSSGGFLESSDNLRISRHNLGKESELPQFLLPNNIGAQLIKLNPIEMSLSEGWAHFKTDEGTIFSGRIMKDDYPNTSKWLKVEGEKLILPKDLQGMIERGEAFSKRDHFLDESITISIENKKLVLGCEAEGSGWFEEETPIRFNGQAVKFSITPYLLKGILSKTSSCIIGKQRIKFEGNDWEYMSLLRKK